MVISGCFLTDVSDIVVKVYHLCRVSTIRIAASTVMDSWNGHTVPLSDVFKMTFEMKYGFDLTTTGL